MVGLVFDFMLHIDGWIDRPSGEEYSGFNSSSDVHDLMYNTV